MTNSSCRQLLVSKLLMQPRLALPVLAALIQVLKGLRLPSSLDIACEGKISGGDVSGSLLTAVSNLAQVRL